MTTTPHIVHASCVSWQGRGVLLLGAAGSGKSTFALQMIGLGCDLVADDRTQLKAQAGIIVATCPSAIQGKIEARGMGILTIPFAPSTTLACALLLDCDEDERYPPRRSIDLCGMSLRLFHKPATKAGSEAILQYLKHGDLSPRNRSERPECSSD